MPSNRRPFQVLILCGAACLSGCTKRYDEVAKGLGTYLFFIYLLGVVLALLLPLIHKSDSFREMKEKLRQPATVAAFLGMFAGVGQCLKGYFATDAEFVLFYAGVILLVSSAALFYWSGSSSAEHQATCAKIISLGVGIWLALMFLAYWGRDLLRV